MHLIKTEIDYAFAFGAKQIINYEELENHTQIIGYNFDEDETEGASNGAGKTSVFMCLQESLFGKNLKGTLKGNIGNNKLNKGYKLTTHFKVKDKLYKVITDRTVNGKTTLTLIENGIDISAHTVVQTQKKIQAITGFDYTLFTSLGYQSSKTYMNFLTTTDSERKKLLVNLFNLDSYNEEITLFKNLTSDANREMISAKTLLDKCETDSEITIEVCKALKVWDGQLELDNVILNIADERKKLSLVDSHNAEVNKHKHYKEQIELVQTKLDNITVSQPIDHELLVSLEQKVGAIASDKLRIQANLRRYSEKEKNCPTCKQPVPTAFNKDKAKECDNLLAKLIKEDIEVRFRIKKLKEQDSIFKEFKRLNDDLARLLHVFDPSIASKELRDYETIETVIDSLVENKELMENERSLIDKYNSEVTAHNAKQKLKTELKEKAEKELVKAQKRFKEKEQKYSRLKTLNDALKKLVTFKLESLLVHLQESINTYVDYLFNSDVALIISLKNDKLNFSITRDGIDYPVSDISDGEFSRLQIAVLFAIREVLSTIADADINIMFLDEILSSVDSIGRERLYQLLETLPFKVISISHTYYDNKLPYINIIKENGIARIENA